MRASVFLFGLSGVALATVNLVSGLETGGYWYEKVKHNGMFSVANSKNYVVYRNAKDYGAKGDGTTDDSAAIQKAINTVEGSGSGSRVGGTTLTGQPAVVYFPPGTYLVNSGIKNIMGTVLMGDPTNRPVIKAGANFKDAVMLTGNDPKVGGLVSFFHEIKNLVLDSTAVPTSKSLALLQFSVSQACQLSNVMFNMPIGATGHVGIFTAGPLMPLLMNDLQFFGGSVGYVATALQCQFKNWYFKSMSTPPSPCNQGLAIWGFRWSANEHCQTWPLESKYPTPSSKPPDKVFVSRTARLASTQPAEEAATSAYSTRQRPTPRPYSAPPHPPISKAH
jgi:glucan 1,3-beta-glucosidase